MARTSHTDEDDTLFPLDRALPWLFAGIWILILLTTPQHFAHTRDYGPDLAFAVAAAADGEPRDLDRELRRRADYFDPADADRLLAFPLDLASGANVQLICLIRADESRSAEPGIWIAKRRHNNLPVGREAFYRISNYPEPVSRAAARVCGAAG